jgi:hypothetical protein
MAGGWLSAVGSRLLTLGCRLSAVGDAARPARAAGGILCFSPGRPGAESGGPGTRRFSKPPLSAVVVLSPAKAPYSAAEVKALLSNSACVYNRAPLTT